LPTSYSINNRDISVGDIAYSAGTTYEVRVDNKEIGVIKKVKRKVAIVTEVSHKIVVEKIKSNVLTGEKHEKGLN
jgi:hypothetical protein